MLKLKTRKSLLFGLMLVTLGLTILPSSAGQIVLSNNSGSDSTVWFISGEPSLVMNGFDLTPLNIALPATIDRVSIAVNNPVPGASIDVLIYEDANGGVAVGRATRQPESGRYPRGGHVHLYPAQPGHDQSARGMDRLLPASELSLSGGHVRLVSIDLLGMDTRRAL